MILTHPSYDNIEFAVKHILEGLDEINFRPDLILGVLRGGMFPALLASHTLGVKMETISYSSKQGKGDNRNHKNKLPSFDEYKRILIVEDIIDSGRSMKEIVEFYSKKHEIKTAAVYYKEGAVFVPDLYWWKLPIDSPFITFKWERALK